MIDDAPQAAPGGSELAPDVLRAVVEQSPDGIFIADLAGRYFYVNAAGAELLRSSRNEILGKRIVDLIPPQDVERLAATRLALLQGGHDTSEWKLRRADGSYVDVEINASILPGGHWQAVVRDISQRKAEQAAREQLAALVDTDRQRLQILFDTLPLAVFLFGPEGTLTANRRAEEILGIKLHPELGSEQYASLVFAPDGTPLPKEQFLSSRALRGETIVAQEVVLRRADGASVPVLASCAPIRDPDGRVIGAVGLFQDLSERMHLEREVRRNERLLKAVFDLLPVGVCIVDAAGTIVDSNPAAVRIVGGSRSGGHARPAEQRGWWLTNGRQIKAEEWALSRALRQGETCSGELVRIECADGSVKTIINSAAPLLDEHGAISGAIVVNEDITALYEAQQKLADSEQLFRTVFDLVPVGLWIGSREGRIVSANTAGQEIWQGARFVESDEFQRTYRGWWVETGERIRSKDWALTRAVRHGETSRRELIRIQCFDGSFKTVLNWAAPIRSETGEIIGAVAVNEDVTALHQTQERLRDAVRDREQMLAMVTHDLRNPLNAILAAAQTIEAHAAQVPQAGAIAALLPTLSEGARQMSGLVSDLLGIAVVSSGGRSMLHLGPTSAASLVERAARSARPLFARERINFRVQAEGDLPVLYVDSDRIVRVLANLLDNARKFTLAHGEVVLTARADSAGARFSISNSGEALPASQIENMFRPFWQAGRGDNRGAGLGLSIARSIVEAHGGTIWAESATGQRVRVSLILPAFSAAAAGARHTLNRPLPGSAAHPGEPRHRRGSSSKY